MNKNKLLACGLIFALNSKAIEDEIKLAITGEWKGHKAGDFSLTLNAFNQMIENFKKQKIDLVIDLDHATIEIGTGEAYGWIKKLYIKDDALWAKVHWCEHGKELIKTGKYKYISPVFQRYTIDPVTGEDVGWSIHSAALTNRPFLEDLGEVLTNNKSKKGESQMTKEEQEKFQSLENKLKEYEKKVEESEQKELEKQVEDAIAANKANEEQRESLISLGKANKEALNQMLRVAKPIVNKPENDLYSNNKGEEKIDVLKLGGIE